MKIHQVKEEAPRFYARRIRDLVGHGEGIMGLMDSYPSNLDYVDEEDLCEIEKKALNGAGSLRPRHIAVRKCTETIIHGT